MKTNLTNKNMCDWLKDNGYPLMAHPGEHVKDFLEDMNISAYKLAKDLNISRSGVSGIINGERKITIAIGIKLSHYFSQSFPFWVNLQNNFEVNYIEKSQLEEIEKLPLAVAQ